MSTSWSEEEFWEQLQADRKNKRFEAMVRQIFRRTDEWGILYWSERGTDASFVGAVESNGHLCVLYQVWARSERGGNGLEIRYRNVATPFEYGSVLQQKWEQKLLNAKLPLGPNKERRNFPFEHLNHDKKLLPKFFKIVEWAIKQPGSAFYQDDEEPAEYSQETSNKFASVGRTQSMHVATQTSSVETDTDWLSDSLSWPDIDEENYQPTYEDDRTERYRQIKERRGQQLFRNSLLNRYQSTCPVTGCKVVAALEAAHIIPHRSENDNNPQNGLLLRADVHTLFDLNLIGIEPKTHLIHLHPSLEQDLAYKQQLHAGLPAPIVEETSETALEERWHQFLNRRRQPA